ncbi:hypothetical protein [Mycobacterium sp. SMC-14]|uniref:hypothetical protein n=1 Tax=Mycobacterium sp. SMC-14 TaxID=3385968 RepID=UPI00390CA508
MNNCTLTKPRRRPLTMADVTAAERTHLELCIHEAGHAVAAVALGGEVRSAVVASGRVIGVQGLTTLTHDGLPAGRMAEVAYAGPWAEARFRAGRRPTQAETYAVLATHGHEDDRAMIASSASDGHHTGRDVVPLLERCWPAVVRVAQHLHRTGEACQADVLDALAITDGGGRTSVQLASLRSGCRSVPPLV